MLIKSNLEAVIIQLPVIIKARTDSDGRRLVEVEASNEIPDSEGDVIEQKALLDSADEFVKSGHCDIDHLSEIGHRLNIPNPESFIIGRPTEVKNLGAGRTGVVAEIMRSRDGHNPQRNRFDAFWDTLQLDPPVKWASSIYGFPAPEGVIDCRSNSCSSGASRYHIKSMNWRSLAFTRNPVNDNIKGMAKIVSAKAYVDFIAKSFSPVHPSTMMTGTAPTDPAHDSMAPQGQAAFPMHPPRTLDEAMGHHARHMRACAHTGGINSTAGFKQHFALCCGMADHDADVWAHALMHAVLLSRRHV